MKIVVTIPLKLVLGDRCGKMASVVNLRVLSQGTILLWRKDKTSVPQQYPVAVVLATVLEKLPIFVLGAQTPARRHLDLVLLPEDFLGSRALPLNFPVVGEGAQ